MSSIKWPSTWCFAQTSFSGPAEVLESSCQGMTAGMLWAVEWTCVILDYHSCTMFLLSKPLGFHVVCYSLLLDSWVLLQNPQAWNPDLSPLHPVSQEAFARLAAMCHARSLKLFRLRPKFHLVCHIVRSLKQGATYCINPVSFQVFNFKFDFCLLNVFGSIGTRTHRSCYATHGVGCVQPVSHMLHMPSIPWTQWGFGCWQDEDMIGRTSRISRSCHPLMASTRTIQKCLHLYFQQTSSIKSERPVWHIDM